MPKNFNKIRSYFGEKKKSLYDFLEFLTYTWECAAEVGAVCVQHVVLRIVTGVFVFYVTVIVILGGWFSSILGPTLLIVGGFVSVFVFLFGFKEGSTLLRAFGWFCVALVSKVSVPFFFLSTVIVGFLGVMNAVFAFCEVFKPTDERTVVNNLGTLIIKGVDEIYIPFLRELVDHLLVLLKSKGGDGVSYYGPVNSLQGASDALFLGQTAICLILIACISFCLYILFVLGSKAYGRKGDVFLIGGEKTLSVFSQNQKGEEGAGSFNLFLIIVKYVAYLQKKRKAKEEQRKRKQDVASIEQQRRKASKNTWKEAFQKYLDED